MPLPVPEGERCRPLYRPEVAWRSSLSFVQPCALPDMSCPVSAFTLFCKEEAPWRYVNEVKAVWQAPSEGTTCW